MDYCKRSGSVMAVDYSLSAFKGANQIFTGYPLVIAQTMNKKKKNCNFNNLGGNNDCKNIFFLSKLLIYFQ